MTPILPRRFLARAAFARPVSPAPTAAAALAILFPGRTKHCVRGDGNRLCGHGLDSKTIRRERVSGKCAGTAIRVR